MDELKIGIQEHWLNVPEHAIELLGDLATLKHFADVSDDGVIRIRSKQESLLREDSIEGTALNGGLVPYLRHLSAQKGKELVCDGRLGLGRRFDFADEKVHMLGAGRDVAWLQTAAAAERGLIRLGPRVTVPWLVVQLCTVWPDARVLVFSTHERQRNQFQRRVSEICSEKGLPQIPIHLPPLHPYEHNARGITLAHWEQFRTYRFDFAIVPDACQIEHSKAKLAFTEVELGFRLFGFLRRKSSLAPRTFAYVTAAFGPTILTIPRPGRITPHLEVAWLTVDRPRLHGTDPDTLFRDGIENHQQRNKKIGRLAKALVDGDGQEIKQFETIEQWWRAQGARPMRVQVICASERQAKAIRKAAGMGVIDNQTGEASSPGQANPHARGEPSWAASLWLSVSDRFHDIGTRDVIINAAGGNSIPQLRLSSVPPENRRRQLVIDCKDRHHPKLKHKSKCRDAEYRRRYSYPVGTSELQGQIEDFISRFHQLGAKS